MLGYILYAHLKRKLQHKNIKLVFIISCTTSQKVKLDPALTSSADTAGNLYWANNKANAVTDVMHNMETALSHHKHIRQVSQFVKCRLNIVAADTELVMYQ